MAAHLCYDLCSNQSPFFSDDKGRSLGSSNCGIGLVVRVKLWPHRLMVARATREEKNES